MACTLKAGEYVAVNDPMRAAVYILKTCALREHAQLKFYLYVCSEPQWKWDTPENITIIVSGFVTKQEAGPF